MNLLTLIEGDGTKTRLSIGVDAIAFQMATFFRKRTGMAAILEAVEEPVITNVEEAARANLYMLEWRSFDKVLTAVE
jgi:hypothetical protein